MLCLPSQETSVKALNQPFNEASTGLNDSSSQAGQTSQGTAKVAMTESSFFFLIKCKNIIDQKGAGDQQYREKGTKSLDQNKSKTSLLNKKQREQTPLYKP